VAFVINIHSFKLFL